MGENKRTIADAMIPDEVITNLVIAKRITGSAYPKLLKQAKAVDERLRRLLNLLTNDKVDNSTRQFQLVQVKGSSITRYNSVTTDWRYSIKLLRFWHRKSKSAIIVASTTVARSLKSFVCRYGQLTALIG